MKKGFWFYRFFIFISSLLIIPATAFAGGGSDGSGNGGGGVKKDGIYMTFYTAGLNVELIGPNEAFEIPGMEQVVSLISNLPFDDVNQQLQLFLEAVSPSSTRRYYKVSGGELEESTRQKILQKYAEVTGINTKSLVIYAVTDPKTQVTLLLPEFFKLTSEYEQAAILFHEAYWIRVPESSYFQVIAAEQVFQALLEGPNDPARLLAFMELEGKIDSYHYHYSAKFGNFNEQLMVAARADIDSGALQGGLVFGKSQQVRLGALLGQKYFDCLYGKFPGPCNAYLKTHLIKLKREYPRSLFVPKLLQWSMSFSSQEPLALRMIKPLSRHIDEGVFISSESYDEEEEKTNCKDTWILGRTLKNCYIRKDYRAHLEDSTLKLYTLPHHNFVLFNGWAYSAYKQGLDVNPHLLEQNFNYWANFWDVESYRYRDDHLR